MNERFPSRGELPKNPGRRNALRTVFVGTAAAGLVAGVALWHRNGRLRPTKNEDTNPKEEAEPKKDLERVKEELTLFEQSLEKVFDIAKARQARAELKPEKLSEDGRSCAISAVDAKGSTVMIKFAPLFTYPSPFSSGAAYHFSVNEVNYRLSLADTEKDIGVSNRFKLARLTAVSTPEEVLRIYAIKRAKYSHKEKRYIHYTEYTPSGEHLMTKQNKDIGREYTSLALSKASEILKKRLHTKDEKIHKVLDIATKICKRLAVVEHVDPFQFEAAKGTVDRNKAVATLFDRVYVEYAMNTSNAFNHLVNSKGAGGLMQIIPQTYTSVRARLVQHGLFKETELPVEPSEGRKDPMISALISLYLCIDNYKIKKTALRELSDEELELALVVMYNGSPRLLQTILDEKESLEKGQKPSIKKRVLRALHRKESYKKPEVPKKVPSFKELLLTHRHGNLLPGTSVTESSNYVQKYVWLKEHKNDI